MNIVRRFRTPAAFIAGALLLASAAPLAGAALLPNAVVSNALSHNALTHNALANNAPTSAFVESGGVLADLDGVAVEAVTLAPQPGR